MKIREERKNRFFEKFDELSKEQACLFGMFLSSFLAIFGVFWMNITNTIYPNNFFLSEILYLIPVLLFLIETKYDGWALEKLTISTMKLTKAWHDGDEDA